MKTLNSNWANNRNITYIEKIVRWLRNPIGALVRIVERLYFGNHLFLLIKGYGDISEIKHLSNIIDESLDSENYHFFTVAHVSLQNRLVLLDTGHISAPDHSSHSFLSGNMWKEVHALQKAKNVKRYSKMIPMPFPEYYYHFLIDDIPSLLQTLRANPQYVPIFNGQIPNFAVQVMQSLGIKFEVTSHPVVEIESLLVPKKKLNYMLEFRSELESRLNFNEIIKNDSSGKIFIGRRNLPRGDSKSERALFLMLKDYGFEEISPDELSFMEQVCKFANATTIVSLHGGALSNLVFCKPNTQVIEVFNHEYRTYPFARISKELSLEYKSFEAQDILEAKLKLQQENL
jgi:hypothetical protein